MKKLLLLLFPAILVGQNNFISIAEVEYGDLGIVKITEDIPSVDYLFYDNGAPPKGAFVEVGDNIYDITGGSGGASKLYSYNVSNENFETFSAYFAPLVASNDHIYGYRSHFFTPGAIAEYNIANNTYDEIFWFDSAVAGAESFILVNDTIFGIERKGGEQPSFTLFSYDINNDLFSEIQVIYEGNAGSVSKLILHSNGNIYGASRYGGINGEGYLFEYDIQTNNFSVIHDFTENSALYNLVEGDNGYLYGFTKKFQFVGTGKICKYDISTDSLSTLHTFTTGTYPPGMHHYYPLVYRDGVLFGINCIDTGYNNIVDTAMLFHYDIAEDSFDSTTLDFYVDGSFGRSFSPLYKTSNGTILFATSASTKGKLMKIESNTTIPIEATGTKFGTDGINPKKMIQISDSICYGVCFNNYSGYGKSLFSYNINTNEYQVKSFAIGSSPSDILQASNGKIFISTLYSNTYFDGMGMIQVYDPATDTLELVHDFGDAFATNAESELHLFEKDNIIYGIKGFGGNNQLYSGTIFSIDANTLEFNVLYESTDMANNPYAFFSSEGILYGVAKYGGANGQGYLYSFDPQSNTFTIVSDLAYYGSAYFFETPNGDIYGTLQHSPSTDGAGSVFKIDGTNQSFSTLISFPLELGNLSFYVNPSLIEISGDVLYIKVVDYHPPYSRYRLMAFNLSNLTPYYLYNTSDIDKLYLMNDGRLFGTRTNYLYSDELVSIDQGDDEAVTIFDSSSGLGDWYNIIDLNNEPLSLNQIDKETDRFTLEENPVKDYAVIKGNTENIHLRVFNSLGQEFYPEIERSKVINVTDLPIGLYFLNIEFDSGDSQTLKFVKK